MILNIQEVLIDVEGSEVEKKLRGKIVEGDDTEEQGWKASSYE